MGILLFATMKASPTHLVLPVAAHLERIAKTAHGTKPVVMLSLEGTKKMALSTMKVVMRKAKLPEQEAPQEHKKRRRTRTANKRRSECPPNANYTSPELVSIHPNLTNFNLPFKSSK